MNHHRLAPWCLVLALGVCSLAAGNSGAAPSAPATVAARAQGVQPAASTPGVDADAVKELKEQIKALEDRERTNSQLLIETQRKSVDWWLGGISGLIALLAFAGAIIPYVFTQSERGRLALAQAQTDKALNDARQALDDIQKHAATAAQASQDTQKARDEAKLQLAAIKAGEPVTPEESAKHQKAASQVLSDPEADDLSKLRALAVKADEANDATLASHLWQAVAAKAPDDAAALFNAAYWLQESLGRRAEPPSAVEWRHVSELNAAHCVREPQSYGGFNNWAGSLSAEAKAMLAAGELREARRLWAQAGEKCQQALQINPNASLALRNWGLTFADEAQAMLDAGETTEARRLWKMAGSKYEQALQIKADEHGSANNWGNALAAEARVMQIDGNLTEARRLWALAITKYQLALEIKADKHEAAYNWSLALMQESLALEKAGDQVEATRLLHKARDLLQSTSVQSTVGLKALAYNLACIWARLGDVAQCIAQLQVAHTAGKLPDEEHLDTDPDLAAVRSTPEYQAWRQGLPAPWNPVTGVQQQAQDAS